VSGGWLRRAGRFVRPLSAEFGCFMQATHNWADFEATEKSYELYARYVVPHFRQPDVNRAASLAWALDNTKDFNAARESGRGDVRQARRRARGEEARGGVGRGPGMDREVRDCACARDRTGAIFEPLLNEHSMWFTSRRLYPDHTPGSF